MVIYRKNIKQIHYNDALKMPLYSTNSLTLVFLLALCIARWLQQRDVARRPLIAANGCEEVAHTL